MTRKQCLLPIRPQDVTCRGRQQWLRARRRFIGASEAASILGVGYAHSNPLSVWASKTLPSNGDDQFDEALLKKMRIGILMEPVIRTAFKEETGMRIEADVKNTIRVHPQLTWMGATLDGLVMHPDYGLCVAETKNVSGMNAADWADDDAPLKYEIQLQQQLETTQLQWGVLVALIGGDKIEVRWRQREPEFIAQMIERLEMFWRLVESGIPPVVDGNEITSKVLQRLHPDDNGEVIALPDEATMWAAKLKACKEAKAAAEKDAELYENLLRQAIGNATYGMLASGECYSWKTTERQPGVREIKYGKWRTLKHLDKLPKGISYTPREVAAITEQEQTS